jgi:16S rRNA (guanine(527)-N(7))-methyltransferase RsmG
MLPEGSALSPEAFRKLIREQAPPFDVRLEEAALERLARFLSALDAARRRTNLTGPFPSEELVAHALESAMGSTLLPPRARVVDIGSGAGFPGLPLAITRPDLRVTPAEPRRRRAEFLEAVVREIGLTNVAAPCRNVRDLAAGSADAATARAVGEVERLVREADWLTAGGLFLAWTTEPGTLEKRLEGAFRLERSLPVPGSRRKVIALLRRTSGSTWNIPSDRPAATR